MAKTALAHRIKIPAPLNTEQLHRLINIIEGERHRQRLLAEERSGDDNKKLQTQMTLLFAASN